MQRIERTQMLSEELQNLVKASLEMQDPDSMDESEAVARTLHSIFLTRRMLHLKENSCPLVPFYLRMLECDPKDRAEKISSVPDEEERRKLEIANDDLARIIGAEDYRLEGSADLFDFRWAAPLVQQKKSKKGDDTGGVKVQRLIARQQLLDLCLRIRPAISLNQANRFLTRVMRAAPIRHRSPIDAIYYFVLLSGDALGDLDAQRRFVRNMLNEMAQHYLHAAESGTARQSESQRELKEKQELEKQRLREEAAAAAARDAELLRVLKQRMDDGLSTYRKGGMRREEWIAVKREIEMAQAALQQEKKDRGTLKQLEQQRMAEERARQRMIETATIFQQFADVEPGDAEEFVRRYRGELPQMDLLGNHYSARRHLRENLEAVGVRIFHDEDTLIDDHLIQGRRKTEGKNELYRVRLSGAAHATAYVVDDMLLPAWRGIGNDFLVQCGGVLPPDFPDRALLIERFERAVFEESERRGAPAPDTLRTGLQTDPMWYGPFFYRSLRKYFSKADKSNDFCRRITCLQDAQRRFCTLMEDENIFQFITSDYNYECIVGSNKKSWPKEEPAADKSSRLEKITAKASRTFALNRNDVDDVPRSLLLLAELARIDQHLTGNPEQHVNAALIRCGYPGLYARRILDQFALTTISCIKLIQEQEDSEISLQDRSADILSGLHAFLQQWLMEPVKRLDQKLKVEKRQTTNPGEVREKPRQSGNERR